MYRNDPSPLLGRWKNGSRPEPCTPPLNMLVSRVDPAYRSHTRPQKRTSVIMLTEHRRHASVRKNEIASSWRSQGQKTAIRNGPGSKHCGCLWQRRHSTTVSLTDK